MRCSGVLLCISGVSPVYRGVSLEVIRPKKGPTARE